MMSSAWSSSSAASSPGTSGSARAPGSTSEPWDQPDVGQAAGVGRAVVGTLPGRLGGEIQHAEPGHLARVVGPALKVLALFPHRHEYYLASVERSLDTGPVDGNVQAQPTEPSICSSISRLHSTAYSMGRVRVIGSMNPLTIIPMAWVSDRPRLMR